MQIRINTDHNIEGHEALAARISGVIENALSRFSDQITRFELVTQYGFLTLGVPIFPSLQKESIYQTDMNTKSVLAIFGKAGITLMRGIT